MKSLKIWIFGTLTHNRVNSVLGFSVMALLLAAVYLTRDATNLDEYLPIDENSPTHCHLFSGKWVYDNKFAPLYNERECSFMTDDYACQKFGRNESIYQHWRWQPHDCDLPRYFYFSFSYLVSDIILCFHHCVFKIYVLRELSNQLVYKIFMKLFPSVLSKTCFAYYQLL